VAQASGPAGGRGGAQAPGLAHAQGGVAQVIGGGAQGVAQGGAQGVAQGPATPPIFYTSRSSELVTQVRFPLAIPEIQVELCQGGLLAELDLEAYFGPSS
jgi:hypothetical protein